MIPRNEEASHFNFPSIFNSLTEIKILNTLQETLENSKTKEIVLNFEKCHWFDILPLSQLLMILLTSRATKITLHIVGPCRDILPYFHNYIVELKEKLKNIGSDEDEQNIKNKIFRHTDTLPNLRSRAGSFLIGWGVLDVLEDHCNCKWYTSRAADPVALDQMRDHYLFGYGSNVPVTAYEAERVWPFTIVFRGEEEQILDRVNSEELIAGALKNFAGCDAIANGTAQNVLFFEPLENVFEHAFINPDKPDELPHSTDLALVVMRVTNWMYKNQVLTDNARRLLKRLPIWEQQYLESLASKGGAYMEIIIADGGNGIAKTLEDSLLTDTNYLAKRNIKKIENSIDSLSIDPWEIVRYAFESYSTRKESQPPGKRGLAWMKEKLADLGGLIQIITNNTCYVLADFDGEQVEISKENLTDCFSNNINGTYVRLILPLKSNHQATIDRRPKWNQQRSTPSLFTKEYKAQLQIFTVPTVLHGKPTFNEWDDFLSEIAQIIASSPNVIAVLDFDNALTTRWSLEHLFASFLKNKELHGRILGINCIRQVMCRLETVTTIDELFQSNLVFPFFETSLRLYWIGALNKTEAILLRWFQENSKVYSQDLKQIAISNSGYFLFDNDIPLELSFNIEEIEKLVRSALGQRLEQSLEKRGGIYRGNFIMPLSEKTIETYIEPYQIFADGKVADLLCNHLAVLLRWRFAKLVGKDKEHHVITATRIGRDIAMRMPEAYQHKKTFVYFDYHLLKPGEPRLLKDLPPSYIVIVVDIISTGAQVEELIRVCEEHGSTVLGIVSFVDFSPGSVKTSRIFVGSNQENIEHKTFWRCPQVIRDPEPDDIPVDKRTFCVSPIIETKSNVSSENFAQLSLERGLRLLEDSECVHFGHYELFGHHFEFVVNFGRLLTASSTSRDSILREYEDYLVTSSSTSLPTVIVMYPNLSNAHILHAAVNRLHRVRKLVEKDKLRFVEARYSNKGQQRQYWLTTREIDDLREWASNEFPLGYSILIIDDQSITGSTLGSLISLARELHPRKIATMVLVQQPPYNRTSNHREIERQIWAKSDFSCFLNLPVPVFTSSNCPMCNERLLLQKELIEARSEWFRGHISRRIQKLDFRTTLHPQDLPNNPEGWNSKLVSPFSWEDSRILPGPKPSFASRALSVRAAINSNVPIEKILEEVSNQPDNELWRSTVIEIARQWDLQKEKDSEQVIRDALLRVVRGRVLVRRIAALEALRYMKMNVVFKEVENVVSAALGGAYNDDLIVELILLVRRALTSQSFTVLQSFEKELQITNVLDLALSRIAPEKPLRILIDRINQEIQNIHKETTDKDSQIKLSFNLGTIIQRLESILMTSRRPEHHLLHELARYLGDRRTDFDHGVKSALDNAVRVGSLSQIFASLLHKIGMLQDDKLQNKSLDIYNDARILRQKIETHMRNPESKEFRSLVTKLHDLQALVKDIDTELQSQWVNPYQILEEEYSSWIRDYQKENAEVDINVKIKRNISKNVIVIVRRAVFQKIVTNLFLNLKHAVSEDPTTKEKRIEAVFSLHEKIESTEKRVFLNIYCSTRSQPYISDQVENTTTHLYREARFYDVELSVDEKAKLDKTLPWSETWTFRRM